MKLSIGRIQIELLEPSPDLEALPEGQAQTYHLFMALAHDDNPSFKAGIILEQLSLQSLLPLKSRIEHLRDRGLIRLKKCLMAAT
jgi:hypothetical protein